MPLGSSKMELYEQVPYEEPPFSKKWSTYFLAACLALFAYANDGYAPLFTALSLFFKGQATSIAHIDTFSGVHALAVAAGAITLSLAAAYAIAWLLKVTVGTPKIMTRLVARPKNAGPFIAIIQSVVIAEELFARVLFIGFLGSLSSSPVWLYCMFFLGNGLWAASHWWNTPKGDRHLVRTLPQFTVGVVLTTVYLMYGFWFTLAVHMTYNMVVWAGVRFQTVNSKRVLIAGIYLLFALVGFLLCPDFLAVRQWLAFDGNFAIAGWSFWNYLGVMMIVSGAVQAFAELALLDRDRVTLGELAERPGTLTILFLLFMVALSVIMAAVVLLVYSVAHQMVGSVMVAFLAALMVLAMIGKSQSPSNATRDWLSLGSSAVTLNVIQAVGVWTGGLMLALGALIAFVPAVLAESLTSEE
jgi:hypothetical protein